MTLPGTVTLRGRSVKGRNRVRELGDQWRVVRLATAQDEAQLAKLGPVEHGVMLLVESTRNPREARWVHPVNDKDFEVVSHG